MSGVAGGITQEQRPNEKASHYPINRANGGLPGYRAYEIVSVHRMTRRKDRPLFHVKSI